MQIQTKFNIGDFVRVIDEPDHIFSIKGIEVYVKDDKVSVYYRTGNTYQDEYCNTCYHAIREDKLIKIKIIEET
jgi:hypothetical protein